MHNHLCGVSHCDTPAQDEICTTHRLQLVDTLLTVVRVGNPTVRSFTDPDGTVRTVESHHHGLWEDLTITTTRQHVLTKGHVGGKIDETPTPFVEAASDARRRLEAFVWYWAYWFFNANQHLEFTPTTVPAACEWLASFPGLLASMPSAADMWLDITREVAESTRVVDSAPDRIYLGTCGASIEGVPCGWTVWGIEDRATAVCRGCSTKHDTAVMRAKVTERVMAEIGTPTELVQLFAHFVGMQVNVNSIRTWGRKGEYPAVSYTEAGHPRYLALDVFLVAESKKTRPRRSAA